MAITKLLSDFGIPSGKALNYEDYPDTIREVDRQVFMEDMYKDFAPAIIIFQEAGKDEFWEYEYSVYRSHYGDGSNEYPNNYATQVVKKTKTVVTEYWENV